eukprot:gnl/TRDRNA2_/TRDRNA2_39623_c0_seq1.p1 gnl/TRDRNA2_/TRDRNA2_39623_c0~~gnl/TRDRNA2_/TRDRNA2_39623_c0_seq1.p1  ORF type:complete len:288 (-),score=39.57 gnl/TRDRNA2_/TRDRNA2_39623_c0_seq1:72-935(-)
MGSSHVEFTTLFTDRPSQSILGTVLRWCDVSQRTIYGSITDAAARQALLDLYDKAAVNRSIVVEMLVSAEEWERILNSDAGAKVSVLPSITRVGRTSWVVSITINCSRGTPLARAQTVMVSVDAETTSKPTPLPYPEVMKSLVHQPSEDPSGPSKVSERPSNVLRWQTEVRSTDCDPLRHMNNAVYGSLMEDARRALSTREQAYGAGITEHSAFFAGTRAASIEYLGQPKAGDALDIVMWWDSEAKTVGFEFVKLAKASETSQGDEVVAKAAVAVWDAALPSAKSAL